MFVHPSKFSASYSLILITSWANNCAANSATNGVDVKTQGSIFSNARRQPGTDGRLQPVGNIVATGPANGVDLPQQFQPTLPQVNASAGVIKSYILPDKKTGVVRQLDFTVET